MATTMPGEPTAESPISQASPTSSTGQIPLEQPPKLKGRHKLLHNLQRISSSPTLTRLGRSASVGAYRRERKASLSCVSLSTTYSPCLGEGELLQLNGGINTQPTTSGCTSEISHRIRVVGTESPSNRTVPLPSDLRSPSRGSPCKDILEHGTRGERRKSRPTRNFDFWSDMPRELKTEIFRYLTPQEIVRCSAVSKAWNAMCYDGQLWSNVDTTEYYQRIPSDVLVKLITCGGPFVRDLNLRGCVQLRDKWSSDGKRISDLCRNVVNFSLEGCRIDRSSMHYFLLRNPRLEYINVSGLSSVTNSAMKIIAQSCPYLEALNISWCNKVTTEGLIRVVQSCERLKDLRASEVQGFNNVEFTVELFKRNTLERLICSRTDLNDQSLKALLHGIDPEMDILTDRAVVPPRKLRHLDIHHCPDVTDVGLKSLAHNVPELEGLQISQCPELTDDSVIKVIRTTPLLSHLDLEDLDRLTNSTLFELSKAPCAKVLEHLNISYCESLGDTGMLPVVKICPKLRSLEMDNTRVSDLTLMEASFRVRRRGYSDEHPKIGMRIVVFDCINVTWAGVKEVLFSNAYIPRLSRKPVSTVVTVTQASDADSSPVTTTFVTPASTPSPSPTYPNEIIQLKCYHGWQMTVDEHTKRVLRGDLAAASRLDHKWADYMMATQEAGAPGAGTRRRRRRAREAERLYTIDDDVDENGAYIVNNHTGGRRRRAQTSVGVCSVM
ncbi:hypothetical protein N7495_008278 [Penicillium taxi]|uniref:uncharacterized protein n=1 Tax=Penicillium taxi TaxID=168475 RepID=UPI002545061D|nr:uncharacterized protein N7495_008278 [Penicillium taxi]KAJ5888237.1 hypothetical protein N7495_008278 [Penicillium taxi]